MNNQNTPLPTEFNTQVLDNAPFGILVLQHDGVITWSNQTIAGWLDLSHTELASAVFGDIRERQLRPHETLEDVFAIIDKDELPVRWLQQTGMSMDFANNHYNTLYFSDVSERVNVADKLEQLQIIEPVSGLLNRRAMMQNLEPLVSRSRRYENPLSIIVIELLNLEDIRTKYSDDAVNKAILELSHLLRDQLRWADIVSRISDNNIHIVLPETSITDATRLAEKISGQIAQLQIELDDSTVTALQACFGVCAWGKGNDSLLLLRNAKQALESAKNKGAGTIEVV